MRLTLFIYCFIIQSIIFSQNPNHWLQDTSVYHGQLKNGLSYYIQKNNLPKNKVYLKMIVGVGALDEEEKEKGIAHFLEHLAFNGTKKYPKKNIEKFLEKNGMKIGSDFNAYTNYYNTSYILSIDDDKELIEKSIEIMKEWAFEINFTKEEIDLERGVILSEKHSHESANEILNKTIRNLMFKNSVFFKNDIIGIDNQIMKFEKSNFQSFYKKWYTPNNIKLVIVGNVEPTEAEKYIKKYFEDYESKEITHTYNDSIPPITRGVNYHFYNEYLSFNSRVNVQWDIKRVENQASDLYYKEGLIEQLFYKILQKRVQILNDTLIDKINISFSNESKFQQFHSCRSLTINTNKSLDEAFPKAMNLFTNLIENGIEKAEFETTIDEIKNELNQSKLSTVDLHSSYLLSRLNHKVVREERMLSNDETNKLKLKLIAEIWIEDFEKFCKDINFNMQQIWIFEHKNKENRTNLDSIIKNYKYDSSNIKTEIDLFEIKKLVASTPKSGEITQKEIAIDDNVQKLWLSNGSIVIMKPTKIRKNIVFVKYQTIPDSFYIPDFENHKIAIYNNLAVGTDSFKMKHLSKYWKKHLLNSTSNVTKKSKEGTINVLTSNIKYALEQIHFLNSPILWNQKEFELQKERNLIYLKNIDTTLYEFDDKIKEALYKKDYIEERKIDVDKLKAYTFQEYAAIHNKAIENNKFIVSIVGDFEIDSIEPLIVKYIGSLQTATNTSIKPKDSITNYNLKSETVFVKNTKDSLHYFNVILYNKMKFDQFEDDYIFSTIANDMIYKEIKTRIREEKGKIYGAKSRFIDGYNVDSLIEFHITLKTHETNALEVRSELKKIIDEYKNGKIKEKDFDIQKIALKNYLTSEISSNEKWADLLIKNHIEKRNLKEYLTNRIETFHFDIFQNYLKQFFTNNYEIFGEKGK